MSLIEPKVFLRATDPQNANDISNILQYQSLLQAGDFNAAVNFLKTMANGQQMNLSASRYNEIIEEIENIEDFLLNDLTTYVINQIMRYKDINVYDPTVSYVNGNIVSYQGNLYICNAPSLNNLPTDTNYWEIFVQNQVQYPVSTTEPSGLNNGDMWFEEITIS